MVDLAGSERSKDSMYHDAQMQKETAEINESLMALKNCVRELSSNATHVNFRGSSLTQVLKSCFTDANACTVVIATVAPSSGDTDHTLGTLSHAMLMDGQKDGSQHETRVPVRSAAEIHAEKVRASAPKDPKKWTNEEAKAWWGPAAARCLARAKVPLEEGAAAPIPRGAFDGKTFGKWPIKRFQQELGSDKAGDFLFKMYKKAIADQADLRKGVAAVRRGDVTLASTTSSSSGARCSPQRGTPGSSTKKAGGGMKSARSSGAGPAASPARMSKRPSASVSRPTPSPVSSISKRSTRGSVQSVGSVDSVRSSVQSPAPLSPMTGAVSNRSKPVGRTPAKLSTGCGAAPRAGASTPTGSNATPRRSASGLGLARRVPMSGGTPSSARRDGGGVDTSPYGLATAMPTAAESARKIARAKKEAKDAVEYLAKLEANAAYARGEEESESLLTASVGSVLAQGVAGGAM